MASTTWNYHHNSKSQHRNPDRMYCCQSTSSIHPHTVYRCHCWKNSPHHMWSIILHYIRYKLHYMKCTQILIDSNHRNRNRILLHYHKFHTHQSTTYTSCHPKRSHPHKSYILLFQSKNSSLRGYKKHIAHTLLHKITQHHNQSNTINAQNQTYNPTHMPHNTHHYHIVGIFLYNYSIR